MFRVYKEQELRGGCSLRTARNYAVHLRENYRARGPRRRLEEGEDSVKSTKASFEKKNWCSNICHRKGLDARF